VIEQIKSFAERDARGEEIFRKVGGKLLAHYYTRKVLLCDHCQGSIGESNGKVPA